VRDDPQQVDVLEGGTGPPWWESVPLPARRLGVLLAVVVVLAAGVLWLRDRAAGRERAQAIDLVPALAVESSSTSPPGGRVSYFLVVRNDGERPVTVTAITGGDGGVLLSMLDDDARTVAAGAESSIPLSVRLTCAGAGAGAGPLPAELALRREDGGATSREIALEPADLLRDVAVTLCAVRPGLRDRELSGPVLRAGGRGGRHAGGG